MRAMEQWEMSRHEFSEFHRNYHRHSSKFNTLAQADSLLAPKLQRITWELGSRGRSCDGNLFTRIRNPLVARPT